MSLASNLPARSPGVRVPWRSVVWLLASALLLLGVGWLVTHVEPGTPLEQLDLGILRGLAANRVPGLDTASAYASDLASTQVVELVGPGIAIVAAAVLHRWWPLVLMVVAIVGELVLFLNSALLVGRPRPSVSHLDAALPATSSFPSGHTSAAICLYGGLAVIVVGVTRAWWRWLVVAAAVLVVAAVAMSRLYRGAHHPTDVLAGILFAVTWLLVTARACRPNPSGGGLSTARGCVSVDRPYVGDVRPDHR
jgi:membrane-associated phospholipid phosphatase